jgi:hypothetical protein
MNRRIFTLSLPAAALFLGCDSNQKPSMTATVLNNGNVQSAMKTLAGEIDDLSAVISDFDNKQWREVVPEVPAASENVSNAFEALRKALGVSTSD